MQLNRATDPEAYIQAKRGERGDREMGRPGDGGMGRRGDGRGRNDHSHPTLSRRLRISPSPLSRSPRLPVAEVVVHLVREKHNAVDAAGRLRYRRRGGGRKH